MRKSTEKSSQGVEVPSKAKPSSLSVEHLFSNLSLSSPSTSRRVYTPLSNSSLPNRKSQYKESDRTAKAIHHGVDAPKKKNRRLLRKSKSKVEKSSSSPNLTPSTSTQQIPCISDSRKVQKCKIPPQKNVHKEFTCDINKVKMPQNGRAFRKRSKNKYINLRSFVGTAKSCFFQTERAFWNNLNSIENSFSKHKHKYFDSITSISELTVTTSTKNNNLIKQTVTVQQNTNVELKQDKESPSKKIRRPKKEKHRLHKLEKKLTKTSEASFPPTLTEEEAKIGMDSGDLIRGFIRVNPKHASDSYISNTNSTLSDYYVTSIAARNTALDGDEVLLKIKPESEWQDGKPTANVVFILQKLHPRTTVGNLKASGNGTYALFYPRDKRMPVMRINTVSWPNGFRKNPKSFENILFAAKLLEWTKPNLCLGTITDTLGLSGDLCVETKAILKEFCLDVTPFNPDMVQYLPKIKAIPDREFEYREDIRKNCVFTIDPLTARDLDDAVSVKELENNHYEIGVHISDASYYLPEGTSLDKMVSNKATTIYLVNSVYHMLPEELCLHCSLLPGEDKLAFSVFWEMDLEGKVFNTRFARTIVNSCSQLAYEHAQQMIENPEKEFKKEDLPIIFNNFTGKDLSKTVNILQKIASNLREARIRNGSLRMDQIKLLFNLNPHSGEPEDFILYENKESHRLIEEFMLLANISVAEKINSTFPDIAFLRCHEPPKYIMLLEAQKNLETCGIHIDIASSGSIHASLRKYITDDYQGFCRGIVLNHLFAKPMTRARYFCSATMDNELEYSHYALSVPIYTHFTSPIRRYADIMVHRLLAASLGYSEKPKWDLDDVVKIAANCNKQKYNAKRAGEASSDLYLAHYIEKNQPYIQDCVVVDVKDRSFDAIVMKTGSMVRIYQKRCEDNPSWKTEAISSSTAKEDKSEPEKKIYRLIMEFPKTTKIPETYKMVVEIFTVVKVQLKRVPNSYKLEGRLLRPLITKTFERTK